MGSSSEKSEVRAKDFLWIKCLGAGGFGEVWKCHYRHSGVQAVKFLKKLTPQNIEAQQEVLRRVLDHSRILLPVGYGISSSGYDIIMTECATYGDLQTVLDLKRDLSIQRKVQMAVEIAEGMNYLHNKWPKILHLDLKPANIMVFRDYKVKIGDLGLAAVVQEGTGVAARSDNTPPYASPEAISAGTEGAPLMTTKSDVFSYGLLLYRMMFQEPMVPFLAELRNDVDGHVKDDIWLLRRQNPELRPAAPPPPPCPNALWELIQQCWDPSPEARPDFSQILEDLRSIQAALGDAPAEAPPYILVADPPAVARAEAPSDPAGPAPPPLLANVASPQAAASPFLGGPPGLQLLLSTTPAVPSAEQPVVSAPSLATSVPPPPLLAAMVPLRPAAQVPLTPFYGGPAMFEMSDFKTLSALDKNEVESLRSLLSSTSSSDASSDAVRLSAEVACDALAWDTAKPESRPPMATRWLRHTLYLKNMLAPAQDYTVDDLLQLANDTKKGWTEGLPLLDVLPLSWQATDWLVGAWGALHDAGVSAEGTAFRNAMSWGLELQHVQLDELKVIKDAIGADKERVVLMEVLVALKQAAAMEDRIADSQPYLERLQAKQSRLQTATLESIRKTSFNELEPQMEFLRRMRERMRERYPEAMFLPPVLVNEEEKQQMITAMRAGWGLWDAVEEQYKAGLLPPSFFTRDDRWLWRGKEYRELAEPLDITNWYMKNKQWEYKEMYDCVEEGYHYAQGIDTADDECHVDNDRRPSRYRLLQRMERNALGSAASSMGLARKLQAQLGNRKWQEVLGGASPTGVQPLV